MFLATPSLRIANTKEHPAEPHESNPALRARAEERQDQVDSDGVQFRTAASGPAGRDSTSIAGHNFSHASAKGDIVGGNKTKKTAINLGAVAIVLGIVIGLALGGKYIVEKAIGVISNAPSQSAITKDSACGRVLTTVASRSGRCNKRSVSSCTFRAWEAH